MDIFTRSPVNGEAAAMTYQNGAVLREVQERVIRITEGDLERLRAVHQATLDELQDRDRRDERYAHWFMVWGVFVLLFVAAIGVYQWVTGA